MTRALSTRRLLRGLVVLVVALTLQVRSRAVDAPQWTPPVGIPVPSFGIFEVAPATPLLWGTPVPGFYYVDATNAAATDDSNPYGRPGQPRRTIPTALPAGAVVELHGSYRTSHTSPNGIVAAGTAAAPVYIRGVSTTNRPVVTSCWELTGSYYIVENIEFSTCAGVIFLARTAHAALRHSEVHGTKLGGGVGVQSWNTDTTSDVVIWDNVIHDNGDVKANFDQGSHGIAVSARVSNLWVVDNQLFRNSGDGIQINATSAALQPTTHHIYVGRNVSHDNKQTGFWTKQAVDVIFSQNLSYSHRPSNSSLGACMGGQYAPETVWFINNAMWDCDYGIQLASDSDLGLGRAQFFIGNIIIRIHDSTGHFNPNTGWQNCAISLPGGTSRFVLENSINDVDSGVCSPGSTGFVYLYDNLIQAVRADGYHLMFDSDALAQTAQTGRGNVFAPNLRVRSADTARVMPAAPPGPTGSNNVVGDILWMNLLTGNYRLSATSPAIGNGTMNKLGIWEFFQNRYGTVLSRDAYGVSRTTNAVPDSGASEHTNSASGPDPVPIPGPGPDYVPYIPDTNHVPYP